MKQQVRLSPGKTLDFDGVLLASVQALNHDQRPRRVFRVYRLHANSAMPAGPETLLAPTAMASRLAVPITTNLAAVVGYVAERIDDPGTIDVRYWGSTCVNADELYGFFGNEPLANYLYGYLRIQVPGLQILND